MLPVTTENLPNLNLQAVQEAAEHLGLSYPVHVKHDPLSWHEGAMYAGLLAFSRGEKRHVVHLNYNGAHSFILWHELTHAAQCEHWYNGDYKAFFKEYQADLAARGTSNCPQDAAAFQLYRQSRWEAEAAENEALALSRPLFFNEDPIRLAADFIPKAWLTQ